MSQQYPHLCQIIVFNCDVLLLNLFKALGEVIPQFHLWFSVQFAHQRILEFEMNVIYKWLSVLKTLLQLGARVAWMTMFNSFYVLFSLISSVRPFIGCFLSRPQGPLLMWYAGLWLFHCFSLCCFWYSLFSARYDNTLWSQVQREVCTRVEMSGRIYYTVPLASGTHI